LAGVHFEGKYFHLELANELYFCTKNKLLATSLFEVTSLMKKQERFHRGDENVLAFRKANILKKLGNMQGVVLEIRCILSVYLDF
jgi:hypothetical protein